MEQFTLINCTNDQYLGTYDTKVKAIEAMNKIITKINEIHNKTEEDGLSPFDFKIEIIETNDDPTEITSFKKACKYLNNFPKIVLSNSNRNILELKDVSKFLFELNPSHIKALIALNRLFTIAEAWNKADELVPDFSDTSQRKYFPWFRWSDDTAGFVCANKAYTAPNAHASIGSRLCFKSEDRAIQFGKMYADLYNDVLY